VGRRAAAILGGGGDDSQAALHDGEGEGPHVLVAEELGPADVVGLLGGTFAGAAAARGGPNSHAAIVARTMGMPLVLGLPRDAVRIVPGTPIVVDGDSGILVAEPSEDELQTVSQGMDSAARRRSALAAERDLPATTTDGGSIQLFCNVASEEEARAGRDAGGGGGPAQDRAALPGGHGVARRSRPPRDARSDPGGAPRPRGGGQSAGLRRRQGARLPGGA